MFDKKRQSTIRSLFKEKKNKCRLNIYKGTREGGEKEGKENNSSARKNIHFLRGVGTSLFVQFNGNE